MGMTFGREFSAPRYWFDFLYFNMLNNNDWRFFCIHRLRTFLFIAWAL